VPKPSYAVTYLLVATLVLSAFLLFCFQPMVGKMMLPLIGGAASVWTTAVFFFQFMLLAGYLYADRLVRLGNFQTQIVVHILLMIASAFLLPIRFDQDSLGADAHRQPVLREFLGLLKTAGIPYFVVSTTAPLLQKWFSRTDDSSARDPYFLYAFSNAGSLLALLAYPFVIEPAFGVRDQSFYWMGGYVVLTLLAATLCVTLRRIPATSMQRETTADSRPDLRTCFVWLAASFVPSGLMLAVTTHISVNLTPMPMVWTMPLAIYLVTFILAFGRRIRVSSRRVSQLALPVLVLLCPVVGLRVPVVLSIDVFLVAIHLVLLFVGCLLCHTALADKRPDPQYLTQYFVWIAAGGVLGGIFAAIVAPSVFTSIFEYPLLLAYAMLFRQGSARTQRAVTAALALLVLGYAIVLPPLLGEKGEVVHVTRNFFGVKKVIEEGTERQLLHGDTLHGVENRASATAGVPMMYYHREGPLGDVMEMMRGRPGQHVGVIGLGAGSIAAYAGPQRRVTFFEIDPDVEKIAAQFFTFMGRCGNYCEVVSGDGRLELAVRQYAFDLIVLDAFSSDVIPTHLVSREALDLYLLRLKPDGVLLFHTSSRYLKVKDLVGALVTAAELPALIRVDRGKGAVSNSIYVAAGKSKEALGSLPDRDNWITVSAPQGVQVWTDDYSSLAGLLQWEDEPR
jgi:SAM-dependent methyltransferase